MRRETTNAIRTVLEEVLPPFVRDSAAMRWLFRRHWGRLVDDLEDFRARIPFVTPEEYRDVYARLPRVQSETDNSAACIDLIARDMVGESALDVGCGTGYLLHVLSSRHPEFALTGVDFIIDEETRKRAAGISFREANIETLPFEDDAFDTVICTHVLEHILDFRGALAELRRVAKKRVIIVVPQEREYRFTFNPHLHFFPYPHSFLRYVTPVPVSHAISSAGRDIYYREDIADNMTGSV